MMLLKVDCLPNAVGKQPSIPLIYLGRKWTLNWWWWWWWWWWVEFVGEARTEDAKHPSIQDEARDRVCDNSRCLMLRGPQHAGSWTTISRTTALKYSSLSTDLTKIKKSSSLPTFFLFNGMMKWVAGDSSHNARSAGLRSQGSQVMRPDGHGAQVPSQRKAMCLHLLERNRVQSINSIIFSALIINLNWVLWFTEGSFQNEGPSYMNLLLLTVTLHAFRWATTPTCWVIGLPSTWEPTRWHSVY